MTIHAQTETAKDGPANASDNSLTAQQIVELIQRRSGVNWRQQTVDTFKAGDPNTKVTGITTTMFSTLEVMQKSAAAGRNMLIVHEPTFYSGSDDTSTIEGDAVLAQKRAFIKEKGLIVWRFHDHWHAIRPDPVSVGVVRKLGWTKYLKSNDRWLFEFPETTLREFADSIAKTYHSNSVRVIGDPNLKFTKVGFVAGAPGPMPQIRMLQRDDVEVLVGGETREWETVEYVRDAVTQGRHKAMILMGHNISEEAGAEVCAEWLREFVQGIPIEFVPSNEPFWSPKVD